MTDVSEIATVRETASSDTRGRYTDLWVALAVAAATFLLYAPSLYSGFIDYDDATYVADNPYANGGVKWDAVKGAFSHGYFANYLPATMLSHMLDVQLWGLKPGGHHATSNLLHAINAALVYVFLSLVTGARGRSLAAAVLFAAHPLRVESVVWIAERKDVLAATFFLLTLLAYSQYARRPGRAAWAWYAAAVAFDALGLLSKTMLVTVPFVLLLVDVWPLRRTRGWADGAAGEGALGVGWGRLTLEKVPFAVLSVVASKWTYVLQREGGAFDFGESLSLGQRVANAVVSVPRYLGKTAWPANLSIFYPHPRDWALWKVALAAALIVLVSAAAIWQLRRRPWLAVGWFWFVGMLVPVSGIVQVGPQSMADRYTYLTSIGLLAAVVWWAAELAARSGFSRRFTMPFTVLVALAMALATVRQQRFWRTSMDLFQHGLAVNEADYLSHDLVGVAYLARGDAGSAAPHFARSIELNPTRSSVRIDYAIALGRLGQRPEALKQFKEAARLAPRSLPVRTRIGDALLEQGEVVAASQNFAYCVKLNPGDPGLHARHGVALARLGRANEAVAAFDEALRLSPGSPALRAAREEARRARPVATAPSTPRAATAPSAPAGAP